MLTYFRRQVQIRISSCLYALTVKDVHIPIPSFLKDFIFGNKLFLVGIFGYYAYLHVKRSAKGKFFVQGSNFEARCLSF